MTWGASRQLLLAGFAVAVATGCGSSRSAEVPAPSTARPPSRTVTADTTGRAGEDMRANGTNPPATDTRPGHRRQVLAPVPIGQDAGLDDRVYAAVTAVDRTELAARGPGETAGPGVVVTVRLRNEGSAALDLDGVAVNARDAAGTPAPPAPSAADPLGGELPPGGTATGRYAFRIPRGDGGPLVVEIHHGAARNVVVVDLATATE